MSTERHSYLQCYKLDFCISISRNPRYQLLRTAGHQARWCSAARSVVKGFASQNWHVWMRLMKMVANVSPFGFYRRRLFGKEAGE